MKVHETTMAGRRAMSAALACLALLPLSLFAQEPNDRGKALSQEETERRESTRTIEENRGAYATALLEKWQAAALEKGFPVEWKIEGFARLAALPAEKFLAANQAESFAGFSAIAGIGVKDLGSLASDLVYTPVTPCRVLDTRLAAPPLRGPIPGGTTISFQVNDSFGAIPSQGGNPGGCPEMSVTGEPAAVVVTLTAVPSGVGNLRAFAYTGFLPTASVLNYNPGANIANTTIVPACQACGPDISVRVDVGATQIIADVVGYFRPPIATPTDVLVQNASVTVPNGSGFDVFTPSCPAGWRVTGGGFVAAFHGDRIYSGSRPAIQGFYGFDDTVGVNWADSWLCQGVNDTGLTTDAWCYVICSRVPGL